MFGRAELTPPGGRLSSCLLRRRCGEGARRGDGPRRWPPTRGLYGFLRELDQRGCDLIVASLPEEEGPGLAIANRLRRAAGPRTARPVPTPCPYWRPGGFVTDSAERPPVWQAGHSSCRQSSVTTVPHPRHASQPAARARSAWGTVLGAGSAP
ncbi:Sua5 family C-terminal domain-containing protein [Streptomyces sp. NPDC004008]